MASPGIATRNCWTVQSAVGCAVAFQLDDPPGTDFEDDEYIDELDSCGHNDEEVTGQERLRMIANKCCPALRVATRR